MAKKSEEFKVAAENRKAFHDYHIMDRWEAGIVLMGPEVKSIREGKVNLRDSYIRLKNEEVFVVNLHISLYAMTRHTELDPTRERKLLLKHNEIKELIGKISRRGLTCVPIKLYFKNGRAKLEIALCQGKQLYDKREDLKKKVHQREMDRAVKSFRK